MPTRETSSIAKNRSTPKAITKKQKIDERVAVPREDDLEEQDEEITSPNGSENVSTLPCSAVGPVANNGTFTGTGIGLNETTSSTQPNPPSINQTFKATNMHLNLNQHGTSISQSFNGSTASSSKKKSERAVFRDLQTGPQLIAVYGNEIFQSIQRVLLECPANGRAFYDHLISSHVMETILAEKFPMKHEHNLSANRSHLAAMLRSAFMFRHPTYCVVTLRQEFPNDRLFDTLNQRQKRAGKLLQVFPPIFVVQLLDGLTMQNGVFNVEPKTSCLFPLELQDKKAKHVLELSQNRVDELKQAFSFEGFESVKRATQGTAYFMIVCILKILFPKINTSEVTLHCKLKVLYSKLNSDGITMKEFHEVVSPSALAHALAAIFTSARGGNYVLTYRAVALFVSQNYLKMATKWAGYDRDEGARFATLPLDEHRTISAEDTFAGCREAQVDDDEILSDHDGDLNLDD